MRNPFVYIARLPIKWKLTLWSSLLIFLLFFIYNMVQYTYIEKWMSDREKQSVQQNMTDILNYFLERESAFEPNEMTSIRHFLNKMNQKNQLIRVIDAKGEVIVTVNNEMADTQVLPQHVTVTEIDMERGEHALLVMRSPLTIHQFNGTIEIVRGMDEFDQLSGAIYRVMLFFGLSAILLSGIGGGLLAWQLLKPLKSMAQTMRSIKKSGLHERMKPINHGDELSDLMMMFNEMMDQVEGAFRQQKQFVEDASHELRTPLAILEGHLSMLQRWGKEHPERMDESLHIAREELARLKQLVQELLQLSRLEQESNELQGTDFVYPAEEIEKLIKSISLIHPEFEFDVQLELPQVQIAVPASYFEQLLLILLDNAMKYSPSSTTIQLTGNVQGNQVIIAIHDEGIGIPAEDLPFVMNRFYRVDKARSHEGRGNGLGLAIAKQLVERHGGTIVIASTEGKGTTVQLSFCLVNTMRE